MARKENFTLVFRSEKQRVSPRIRQVYLEITTHCNLSCRSCVRQSIAGFRKCHFTPQLMKRLMPMLERANPERIVLLGFGEALCSPHIKEHLAALRGLDTKLVLVSNASFLSEEMSRHLVGLPLDELYVSWDDDIFGEETSIRRGARSDLFRDNIETLAAIRASSKGRLPVIGLQIVATRANYRIIAGTLGYGREIGVDQFIVSNLYPYSEAMTGETLYDAASANNPDLRRLLRREMKKYNLRVASQKMHKNRACPFMERGTVFITAGGEIAPCPELAYTHPAFYSGLQRTHQKFILGNIRTDTLEEAWNGRAFEELRKNFLYYDYPDCAYCYRPDMCYKRTVEGTDCYGNMTPCGECLWAKGIIICP